MAWPHPRFVDWKALRDLGFIRRRPDNLYHDLLPKGLMAAGALTRDLCGKFNVHVLTMFSGSRGVAPRGSCSCGEFSHIEFKGHGSIGLAFDHHLRRSPTGSAAPTSILKLSATAGAAIPPAAPVSLER